MNNKELATCIISQFDWWELENDAKTETENLLKTLRKNDKQEIFDMITYFEQADEKNDAVESILIELKKRLKK